MLRAPSLAFLACLASSVLASGLTLGCATETENDTKEDAESSDQNFSSREVGAARLRVRRRARRRDSSWNEKQTIQDQLLYTIGHLNGDRSVGRLDSLVLTNIQTHAQAGGKTASRTTRSCPSRGAARRTCPTTYELTLPRSDRASRASRRSRRSTSTTCVDCGAHDVDAGAMWYYYRPQSERLRARGRRTSSPSRRRSRARSRTRPASTPSTTRSGRTTRSRSSRSSASTRRARRPRATPASPRTTSSSRR